MSEEASTVQEESNEVDLENVASGSELSRRKKSKGRFPRPYNDDFKKRDRQVSSRNDEIIAKLVNMKGPTCDLPPLKQNYKTQIRLFVGNLPPSVSDAEITDLFKKFGEVNEVFINETKAFAFVKMDCCNGEKAKCELNGYNFKGRYLVVKSAHCALLRVKNLSPHVSNELLHMAFSIFGPVECCYIILDERGKHTGEGVVEYHKKSSITSAIKYCSEQCYFLTSNLKPVVVEEMEPPFEKVGYPELMMRKGPEFYQAREQAPRFASVGTFEYDYGKKWKEMIEKYNLKFRELKAELTFETQKLDAEMMSAQYDHETQRLREMVRIREMDRERVKQQLEARQRHFGNRTSRLHQQDALQRQANQLNNLLDDQEQKLQGPWHLSPFVGEPYANSRSSIEEQSPPNDNHYWMSFPEEAYRGLPPKRLRH